MKSTGIVRKLDELGRVVIPIETRKLLDLKEKDSVEIFTEGDLIILRKFRTSCAICSGYEGLKDFRGMKICIECLNDLKER